MVYLIWDGRDEDQSTPSLTVTKKPDGSDNSIRGIFGFTTVLVTNWHLPRHYNSGICSDAVELGEHRPGIRVFRGV